jgi:hypothetical protein
LPIQQLALKIHMQIGLPYRIFTKMNAEAGIECFRLGGFTSQDGNKYDFRHENRKTGRCDSFADVENAKAACNAIKRDTLGNNGKLESHCSFPPANTIPSAM